MEEDEISGVIYMDQTGALSVILSKGNRYIMVMLEYDSNYILVKPMRNRTTAEILCAHQHLIDCLNERGIFLINQVLDNEVSVDYKHQITTVN